MNFLNKISFLIVLFALSGSVFAQKVELRPLGTNVKLQDESSKVKRSVPRVINEKPLNLPFVEDFSEPSVYPNSNRWQDRTIYINNQFAFYPPTAGVATLDGYDENGMPYPHLGEYSQSADSLTSQRIRLDSVFSPFARPMAVSDSLYLSFYIQPGGGYGVNAWDSTFRGNVPQKSDRLILEFFDISSHVWREAWSTEGFSLDSMCKNCSSDTAIQYKKFFKQIFVPIIDSVRYFSDSFQFRFRNLTSLEPKFNSPRSQWHVDYVYLNTGRNINDHYATDLAFVDADKSLLQTYTSIPARHFRTSDLKSQLHVYPTNLDNKIYTMTYHYDIIDPAGNIVNTVPVGGSSTNIFWFDTLGYRTLPDISSQPVNYTFPNLIDNAGEYQVRHILSPGSQTNLITSNDTLSNPQVFDNYYAYDDGSAEALIGLSFEQPQLTVVAELTLAYVPHVADTLTAIDLYLAPPAYESENAFSFLIRPKKDTIPDDPIYISQLFRPDYSPTGANRFQRFFLDTLLPVPADTIYIGFRQLNSDMLNIGFDQNTNTRGKLFYYNGRKWSMPYYYGTMMIRPVFREKAPVDNRKPKKVNQAFQVLNNPVTGNMLYIKAKENSQEPLTIRLFDIYGRVFLQQRFQEQIMLPDLTTGMYYISIGTNAAPVLFSTKIMIAPR